MRPARPGSRRAASSAAWLACLGLVACAPMLMISGPTPETPSPAWQAGDPICVVQPEDRRSGDVVYFGSGAAVANQIARQLVQRQAKVIKLEGVPRPLEACAARRGQYAVVPVILDWERHTGFFANSVRAKLHLSLIRPPGEQPLRTVDFALQDTELNLFLFSPPALPPKQLDEAVLRLLPQ